ncbi:MAG: hypothetical protein LBD20_04885 [Spirochaetaceae bacterium]|jgi:tetratricopeptide (TPR) repeat protein|nr:hypothetical protein [Spirochaetaceae bacterium]
MIEMLFSIKFRSQLARTRPDVLAAIENSVITCTQLSGASIRRENKTITAFFDEKKIGFWVDIIFVIETIQRILAENQRVLYGHSCIFAKSVDYDTAKFLRQNLSRLDSPDSIWCAKSISTGINNFVAFKNDEYSDSNKINENYLELEKIKECSDTAPENPLRKKTEKKLLADKYRNTVLFGPEYTGKSDCLEWYCRKENGFSSPLIFRFVKHGSPINCYLDAFSGTLKNLFVKNNIETTERITDLYNGLFYERLRDEISTYTARKAADFLSLIIDGYIECKKQDMLIPVIILENIQNSGSLAAKIFIAEWQRISKIHRITVLGTSADTVVDGQWKQVFNNGGGGGMISCDHVNPSSFDDETPSESLWEIAYTCCLFSRFFPSHLCVSLFEEEGKNPDALQKPLELLVKYGIIRSIENPVPAQAGLVEKAEALLGGRTLFIRAVVKNRLLDWVSRGAICPCFNLLDALHGLDAECSHLLALECIKSDIINSAFSSIENAVANGRFEQITGQALAPSLLYIYNTLKSLIYGNEEDIHRTFKTPPPEAIPNAEYKAQILALQAIYKIGINATSAAMDQIKESLLLCQTTNERTGISLVYRLFAIVNFSKQEINDAIDYLNYAVEYNEKSKDHNEQMLGYYYSSAVHYVYGNISRSQRIVHSAINAALLCGSAEWARKSEFLLARCFFEIGEYKTAKDLFEALQKKYDSGKKTGYGEMIRAWIERSKLYLGSKHTSLSELSCSDALLFCVEENYINGNYEAAVEIAGQIAERNVHDDFVFLEQPCWASGFSQCELLSFSRKDFWNRIALVWRSLAVSKLGRNGQDEAVQTMQKIMRDEKLNDSDPNVPFYFFANYKIVSEAGLSEVDRNTAISVAFKRLQRRACRIDDVKTRQSYLTNQYWNSALFLTAKEYKLI